MKDNTRNGSAPMTEERFHDTKKLLSQYRRIQYAVDTSAEEINARMEIDHGTQLFVEQINAELAGIDLSGTKLEKYAQCVIRSKNMLSIIDSAMERLKRYPMNTNSDSSFVYWKIGNNSIAIPLTQTPVANSNWVKISATYTHPDDATPSTANVILGQDDSGTTVFSDLQLVESTSSTRYNLVSNSDFRKGTIGWTKNSSCTSDDTIYVPAEDAAPEDIIASAAPQLDTSYYQIIGNATAAKTVSQTITLSGSEDDVFTLAGWGKGDSVPLSGDRKFGLAVTFIGSDGTAGEEHLVSFNPDSDSENNWQYAATKVVADKNYTSVRVDLLYCNNQNTAYFDGIQLYKEEFGQSYVYDEETGLVKSVIDLQKQETNYEYADNQLTGVFEYLGEYKKYIAEYEYDEYNNVTKAIAEDGTVTYFAYDAYGNNTAVAVSDSDTQLQLTATDVTVDSGGPVIASFAKYTTDGNYLETVTDPLGKITTYNYAPDTGMLNWIYAPGELMGSRTAYEYDEDLFRTEGVSKGDASVSYSYAADLLSTITSASGTIYDFTYDDFDLVQSVGISKLDDNNDMLRGRTLISHEYSNDGNFYLTKSTYGNGDTISYAYDDHGRTTSKTYEDGNTVSYAYDNNGNLGLVTDSAIGRTTKYLYDFQDRLSRYEETGNGYSSTVEWAYNTDNNLTTQTHVLNGTTYTTEYAYDDETKRLTGSSQGSVSVSYEYDSLGRMTDITGANSGTSVVETKIGYTNKGDGTAITSSQVATWANKLGSAEDPSVTYSYTYDDRGNIETISDGTNTTRYTYDYLDQLIREDNQAAGKTWVYSYNVVDDYSGEPRDGGNIQEKLEFAYTTGSLSYSDVITDNDYVYADDLGWVDLLTSYNDQSLNYDGVGNLENDGIWNYTWEHGRQLAQMRKLDDTSTITYTYNADGLRISKTVDATTTQYYYVGDTLTGMTRGNDTLYFVYDVLGPSAVIYNGVTYYYTHNAQGDITGIVNASGVEIAKYAYDAWGNPIPLPDAPTSTIGELNPLRYRGYVYDTETGLYYLQSRYYNPEWGRFINADTTAVLTVSPDNATWDKNLFAYCDNNPVSRKDDGGQLWNFVIGGIVGAVVGGASAALSSYKTTGSVDIVAVTLGAATGAVGGVLGASGIHWAIQSLASAGISAVNSIGNAMVAGQEITARDVIIDAAIGGISSAIGYRVTKGAAANAQKTIKKGINRILSGVERYSNGSRYWKGAVKRGLEMVSDGVFKLNVAQGKASVIGSGVAGIASTVKTLLC